MYPKTANRVHINIYTRYEKIDIFNKVASVRIGSSYGVALLASAVFTALPYTMTLLCGAFAGCVTTAYLTAFLHLCVW